MRRRAWDLRRWPGVRTGLATPAGRVIALPSSFESEATRAISSTRSAEPWTSGRHEGTATTSVPPAPVAAKPRAARMRTCSSRGIAMPTSRSTWAVSSGKLRAVLGTLPAIVTSEGVPPQRSRIIRVASSMPRGVSGIDPALEAVAGVGVDAVAPAGPCGAHGVEICRLDEDVGGRLGAAAGHAADDAADRLWPALVADQRLGAVELVALAVEGREALAGAGEADGDRSVDLGRVEDVQRAAAVEGDEVGDIDQRRDRPEADGAQAGLQPGWRRAVRNTADQPADEERAGLGCDVRGQVDRDRTGELAGNRDDLRGLQPAQAASGEVAGDAGDPQRVGAVGGDGHVYHGIESRHVDVARTHAGAGGQLEDAVVLLRDSPSRVRTSIMPWLSTPRILPTLMVVSMPGM